MSGKVYDTGFDWAEDFEEQEFLDSHRQGSSWATEEIVAYRELLQVTLSQAYIEAWPSVVIRLEVPGEIRSKVTEEWVRALHLNRRSIIDQTPASEVGIKLVMWLAARHLWGKYVGAVAKFPCPRPANQEPMDGVFAEMRVRRERAATRGSSAAALAPATPQPAQPRLLGAATMAGSKWAPAKDPAKDPAKAHQDRRQKAPAELPAKVQQDWRQKAPAKEPAKARQDGHQKQAAKEPAKARQEGRQKATAKEPAKARQEGRQKPAAKEPTKARQEKPAVAGPSRDLKLPVRTRTKFEPGDMAFVSSPTDLRPIWAQKLGDVKEPPMGAFSIILPSTTWKDGLLRLNFQNFQALEHAEGRVDLRVERGRLTVPAEVPRLDGEHWCVRLTFKTADLDPKDELLWAGLLKGYFALVTWQVHVLGAKGSPMPFADFEAESARKHQVDGWNQKVCRSGIGRAVKEAREAWDAYALEHRRQSGLAKQAVDRYISNIGDFARVATGPLHEFLVTGNLRDLDPAVASTVLTHVSIQERLGAVSTAWQSAVVAAHGPDESAWERMVSETLDLFRKNGRDTVGRLFRPPSRSYGL